MKKESMIIIVLIALLGWYTWDTLAEWFATPETINVLSEETNVWKWPTWATFVILSAAGYTWFVIYQNSSKKKRDNQFAKTIKEEDGKLYKNVVIDDEAGKDIYVEKGRKKFMTMDTEKLKDLNPDDFE